MGTATKQKIKELERRVRELESRPAYVPRPTYPKRYDPWPYYPTYPIYPFQPPYRYEVWCGSNS